MDWIRSEELCDFDPASHWFLSTNFPAVQLPEDDSTGTAEELITPAAGEDVDDQDVSSFEGYKEPTEKQKRTLLKIHLGVGHPPANVFGRALHTHVCIASLSGGL